MQRRTFTSASEVKVKVKVKVKAKAKVDACSRKAHLSNPWFTRVGIDK